MKVEYIDILSEYIGVLMHENVASNDVSSFFRCLGALEVY